MKELITLTLALILIVLAVVFVRSVESVDTGNVGVLTTFGEVDDRVLTPGLNMKSPWQSCHELDCRVQSYGVDTEAFSKDLQLVEVSAAVQYRLAENRAAGVFARIGSGYVGQVSPRVVEVIKQELSLYDSEEIIAKRETIRKHIVDILTSRVGDIVEIRDVVLTNIGFSDVYEKAIESKQVAMQDSLKARYELEKATVESKKLIVIAEGEAKAIQIRGEAIRAAPGVVQLEAIKKWNGVAPTTVMLGADCKDIPVVFPVK